MPGQGELPRALLRELPRLKREHSHVYAVETAGGVFAIRALNLEEFKFVQEKVEREQLPEVSVVEMALVWPDEIPEDAPAGVFPTLAKSIVEVSGWENPVAIRSAFAYADQMIEEDPEHFMVMTICRAFPAYKPEDLYSMKFLDFMLRYKQAERMLQLEPTEVVEAGQPRPERARRKPRHPIRELGEEEMMAFGADEDFVPEPVDVPRRSGADPLRDPNLPPPDFKRDNEFFRKHFGNALTKTPVPGEV